MEVEALYFRGEQEPLRLLAKEKNRGVGRLTVIQKVQMGKDVAGQHGVGQRILPLASLGEEPTNAFGRNVVERGIAAGGGVERQGAQLPMALQILHKTGIDS